MNHISFDVVFIGAAGLKNGIISFEDQEDAYLKQLVLKNAKVKILLAETSKFEKSVTFSIGDISEFDYFITNENSAVSESSLENSSLKIIY
ncbi:hypothetical protein [Lederbergia sp. NSJ-179]|uniref:hypothetical protein n=1 Tax=Lederbergia sp. NSJ-179 TaxID=2931402 RepID=UPI002456A514|nr:hypothetical protein [Lederbergia sp. NSJ-179]